MKLSYFKIMMFFTGVVTISSCKKFLDINKNPDALPDSNAPIAQLLTSAQVNLGFEGGSDLFRYTTLIMQQMSGEASQPNQTYEYYRYNITGSDENNVWGSMNATTLNDLELIIKQGSTSPYYTGVAKVLKAYEYSLMVDTWGKIPFSAAQQLTGNTQPAYDNDATIYSKLLQLLDAAIVDLNATSSVLSPGTNSVFYPNATFATVKPQWIKLANTIKLRLLLHYKKIDPTWITQINTLISSGATFMASNADNFSLPFYDLPSQRSPIAQFESSRANYLFADKFMVDLMSLKGDPRRPYYFTSFPFQASLPLPATLSTSAATGAGNVLTFTATTGAAAGNVIAGINIPPNTTATAVTATTITLSANVTGAGVGAGASIIVAPNAFVAVSAAAPPAVANNNYSRIHTFLRGALITPGAGILSGTYSGAAPQRLVTFAEYNFIRAEHALAATGIAAAQVFYQAGITASMQEVGVSPIQIADYLTVNGTLPGTVAAALQKIIEEKYIALFGVSVEPWTDWRRTGYPLLTPVSNSINGVTSVPRTLFYPQSEIDLNPNCPGQKSPSLQDKVFWDN
jgi:hypothetical protein